MCEAMERIEARGKREGKRETMIETAKRLLANGKLMLKEIAECSGLSLAQVKKLQASMALEGRARISARGRSWRRLEAAAALTAFGENHLTTEPPI